MSTHTPDAPASNAEPQKSECSPGDRFTLKATKWVQQGFCLGHLPGGRPVFIHGALPDEEVRVRISRAREGHAFAVVEEVITASPDRQASDCTAFPECGGCSFRQISYDDEFALKLRLLSELPHLQAAIDLAKQSADRFRTHRAEPDGYRTRARLHQANDKTRPGFYGLHSNAIVPFPPTKLSADEASAIVEADGDLSPQQIGGCLQLAPELNVHFAGEFGALQPGAPEPQLSPESAAKQQDSRSARGDRRGQRKGKGRNPGSRHRGLQLELDDPPMIEDEPWQIPEGGFFQANQFLWSDWLEAAQRMVSDLKLAEKPKTIELFCGTGLLGGALRDMLGAYVGFDNAKDGLDAAARNFKDRRFTGRFHGFDLYRKPVDISGGTRLAIVNPPRAGMNGKQIPMLAQAGIQHVLYSSCNPQTLNRDIERLAAVGYAPRSVEVFDFFPRTPHLEILILLEKKA